MVLETPLVYVGALVLSAVLTAAVRKVVLSKGLLDVPNPRSSHTIATPRGGGLAIVATATAAVTVLALCGSVSRELLLVLAGGGIAVAAVGFADDHYSVSPGPRLAVHLLAAAWAVYWLGGLESLRAGAYVAHLGWSGTVLAALGIVWFLNLFNFMDGIDGIAASEAVFVTVGALPMLMLSGVSVGVCATSLAVGAACLGFLPWNWPPAKIFMGDVGSGYLGFVLSVLALAAARDNPAALWIWFILGGVFFVDTTVTLARRLMRRERIYQAHRTHAYQWLARRWGSHRRVTITVLVVNVFWLLPCAAFAALHPSDAATATLVALVPLVVIALIAGAGRGETSDLVPKKSVSP